MISKILNTVKYNNPNTVNSKVFQNLNPKCKPKGFFKLIKWKATTPPLKWPSKIDVKQYDLPPPCVSENDKIRISFIGHVTFLIQTNNINILTDPVWAKRASPFKFIGPKRVTPPGIKFKDLPKIDLILISHNHYDHLDLETISKLWKFYKPIIIAPLKNDTILKKHIPNIEVITLNWEQQIYLNAFSHLSITLKLAQHWSARGLFDTNKALWGSFLINTPAGEIFFIGDSGYSQDLYQKIGNQHKIFISLIPIGAFAPRWFMQDIHMDPKEAVLAHKDLKTTYSIASHFNTFPLASDGYNQAVNELSIAFKNHQISKKKFIIPEIGKYYWFRANSLFY